MPLTSETARDGQPISADKRRHRVWSVVRAIMAHCVIVVLTLAVTEGILRAIHLKYLAYDSWESLGLGYDAELGWAPVPNAADPGGHNNSIGLRDIEFERASKPTILFLGDSLVWGYNVKDDERFTDLMRQDLEGINIVNAGVNGYGTDQEYLILGRLWEKIRPDVVILVFAVENDHTDNSTNVRYETYKPYLVQTPSGAWEFRGQPPPLPRRHYIRGHWLTRDLQLARVALSVYFELRYRRVKNPDPTEHLIGMIRDFAEQRNARFLVGLQRMDSGVAAFLRANKIPFTNLDGAEHFATNIHWTPKGHRLVADRFEALLSESGLADRK